MKAVKNDYDGLNAHLAEIGRLRREKPELFRDDLHVISRSANKWIILRDGGAKRPLKIFNSLDEAIGKGREMALAGKIKKLVIHRSDASTEAIEYYEKGMLVKRDEFISRYA